MKPTTNSLTIPPPAEIEKRIVACRAELKALSRLLRMSRAALTVRKCRAFRETPVQKGVKA
jgi:hypothetical protein